MKNLLILTATLLVSVSAHAQLEACGDQSIALNCKATYTIQNSVSSSHEVVAFSKSVRLTQYREARNFDYDIPCSAAIVLGNDDLKGDPMTGIYFQATYLPKSDDVSFPVAQDNLSIYMLKDGNTKQPVANLSSTSKTFTTTVEVNADSNQEDLLRTVTYTCAVQKIK